MGFVTAGHQVRGAGFARWSERDIPSRMDLGFRGEVTDYYQRYRRGYPEQVFDDLTDEFALTRDDIVLDLGCATGQLTLPMAGRVRAVIGMDHEPDMVGRGRAVAAELGLENVNWVVGADSDVPAVGALLGGGSLGAVTIGQALHWMDPPGCSVCCDP